MLGKYGLILMLCALALPARAVENGDVVATIAPLHSLVANVMTGVGEPELLMRGNESPHGFHLKPSHMQMLNRAKAVLMIGKDFETFLKKPLETLNPKPRVIAAQDYFGLTFYPPREGAMWDMHNHAHDEHGEEVAEGEGPGEHAYHFYDPHLWLDTHNAKRIVRIAAEELSELYPEHEDAFRRNADATVAKLDALDKEIGQLTEPVMDTPFIVFHDAYQYFEQRYGVIAVGSVTLDPSQMLKPKRLEELHRKIRETNAVCLFKEPQFPVKIADTLQAETGVKIGMLDPLGADVAPGPELYFTVLRNLARSMRECLGGGESGVES